MRIDQLVIENFKKFRRLEVPLHPKFNVLVGNNASGKTSVLEAAAIALSIWLVKPPDSGLAGDGRSIRREDVRLEGRVKGDGVVFQKCLPCRIEATGPIHGGETVAWVRQVKPARMQTTHGEAKSALALIARLYERDRGGERVVFPILASYSNGRAWHQSLMVTMLPGDQTSRRWEADSGCFTEDIRLLELNAWFHDEAVAARNNGGRFRPAFLAVREAILACLPGADAAWYDPDFQQLVVRIDDMPQPFRNLSAGQRSMAALAADLAIRAVTLNSGALGSADDASEVVRSTPGVVLIDELDVHLHPQWQRRVAHDLMHVFPAVQFVCTTHSPQVIGELPRECVLLLDGDTVRHPGVARGADSNWLLDHVMDPASSESEEARTLKTSFDRAVDTGDYAAAERDLEKLRELIGGMTGDLAGLEALLDSARLLARRT
jgi:predicted ATP-binding protein involved in virulence